MQLAELNLSPRCEDYTSTYSVLLMLIELVVRGETFRAFFFSGKRMENAEFQLHHLELLLYCLPKKVMQKRAPKTMYSLFSEQLPLGSCTTVHQQYNCFGIHLSATRCMKFISLI